MAGSKSDHKVNLLDAYVAADVTPQDWLIIAPIALTIFAGAVLLMLRKRTHWQFPIGITVLGLLALINALLLQFVLSEGTQTMTGSIYCGIYRHVLCIARNWLDRQTLRIYAFCYDAYVRH